MGCFTASTFCFPCMMADMPGQDCSKMYSRMACSSQSRMCCLQDQFRLGCAYLAQRTAGAGSPAPSCGCAPHRPSGSGCPSTSAAAPAHGITLTSSSIAWSQYIHRLNAIHNSVQTVRHTCSVPASQCTARTTVQRVTQYRAGVVLGHATRPGVNRFRTRDQECGLSCSGSHLAGGPARSSRSTRG